MKIFFASVTARDTSERTSLHVAAENNFAQICSILLSNEVDYTAVDNMGNNALHVAVKEGHLAVVRTLLTESHIDAEGSNNKGETCMSNSKLIRVPDTLFPGRNSLHVLAVFGKENSSAIFELFMECMPEYPLNRPDAEGSTRESS